MKKLISTLVLAVSLPTFASAATTYTVQPNDTMWKIAVKHQVGVSEIINANKQITNPNMIYVGQKVNIPETATAIKNFEQEVIRLTNVERQKAGLSALTYDWEVGRVARYKSDDMVANKYFSHTSPTYGSPFDMLKSFGIKYGYAGENIAYGQTNPDTVVKAWMNSSGHRANILNKNFTHIGVGYNPNGHYWTQMFTSK